MPIKFPKGFQRRKSSGNALDEVRPSEPTFKVFARPGSSGNVLDMTAKQRLPSHDPRNSFEQDDEDLFTTTRPDAANRYVLGSKPAVPRPDRDSGSGATDHSRSTVHCDSGASSARLSTSSTNPSSVDTKFDANTTSVHTRPFNDIPVPPPQSSRTAGFLRSAGRTFSFGSKAKQEILDTRAASSSSPPPVPPMPAKPGFSMTGRDRASTVSTVGTATAPRLETSFQLDNTGLDGFGDMFSSIGTRSALSSNTGRPLVQPHPSSASSTSAVNSSQTRSTMASKPLAVHSAVTLDRSPWSVSSDHSTDALFRSPSPPTTATEYSPQTAIFGGLDSGSRATSVLRGTEPEDTLFSDSPSQRMTTLRQGKQAAYRSSPGLRHPTSPILPEDDRLDTTMFIDAELASRYEEKKPLSATNKVMTPKEFEKYKKQQEERLRMNKVFGKVDSDESGDDYEDEDEDEIERARRAAKQRKKQEAHMAVYRQTMMKVTGEGSELGINPSSALRDEVGNLPTTVELNKTGNRLSSVALDKVTSRSSDEEEDDDVPLGILAAHGFPGRNRPPTRLTTSSSNPNLRGGAQTAAGENPNRASHLPAFARKLPEDPYYGASLVNQAHRESLAFHASSPNLLMPSGASTAHPHHPAGLVGVIAGEEKARAARRGSPNAVTGQFDLPPGMAMHPGMTRSQTTPNLMVPGMPPPLLSPGDQAQLQMSQQMSQMMEMQMQWMQQMQSFMLSQGHSPQGMPPMPSMPMMSPDPLSPPGTRPQSVPLQNYGNTDRSRTMSTLTPNATNWNQMRPQSSYAASIAPSERSNVGLASRYRPVSTFQDPAADSRWQNRLSTMTSSASARPISMFNATSKPAPGSSVRNVASPPDDEDDEVGWAAMKAKRDKKQKSWKLRKSKDPLRELYNDSVVH